MINIVTNFKLVNIFKNGSKYFRVNLGLVQTVEKNGGRSYNEKDKFAYYYNTTYSTTIYGQGNVGDIRFYTDHYIREDVLAVYYGDNFQEFIFPFDYEYVKSKGIDGYLGNLLKECDARFEELKQKDELKKLEPKPKGDPNKVFVNPGQVTWEDLKAYYEQKRKNTQL